MRPGLTGAWTASPPRREGEAPRAQGRRRRVLGARSAARFLFYDVLEAGASAYVMKTDPIDVLARGDPRCREREPIHLARARVVRSRAWLESTAGAPRGSATRWTGLLGARAGDDLPASSPRGGASARRRASTAFRARPSRTHVYRWSIGSSGGRQRRRPRTLRGRARALAHGALRAAAVEGRRRATRRARGGHLEWPGKSAYIGEIWIERELQAATRRRPSTSPGRLRTRTLPPCAR